MYQQLRNDLERVIRFSKATLHHIHLGDLFSDVSLGDFSHASEMILSGCERTTGYLAEPSPNQVLRTVTQVEVVSPPGAIPYNPALLQLRSRNYRCISSA